MEEMYSCLPKREGGLGTLLSVNVFMLLALNSPKVVDIVEGFRVLTQDLIHEIRHLSRAGCWIVALASQ